MSTLVTPRHNMFWKCVSSLAFILLIVAASHGHTYAAGATCNSLTYALSDDKNYYNITVKGSAPSGTTITGYHFDYGDHTTYDFHFDAKSTADRTTATVKHTYQTNGAFAVSAAVITTTNGKTTQVTSESCRTTIVNAPASNDSGLVNTGPGVLVALFIVTVLGATSGYRYYLIRKKTV